MGKRRRLERDWAGLPAELVTIIGEKIATNTGYIHLRLVCKAWRRSLTPNPRHLPPQAPWLMFPPIPGDICRREGFDHSELNFYDLFQSKTHRFRFPYIVGKYICGSSHGWLVLEHDHRVSLFNPITQRVIDLPSLDAPPTLLKSVSSSQQTCRPCVKKAIFSCNPSEAGCVVMAWFTIYANWELGFCQIGGTHWTRLPTDGHRRLLNFTCHKNLVYMVNTKKKVSVYDLQDLSLRTFPSKIKFKISYGLHSPVYDQIHLVEGDSKSCEPLVVRCTEYSKMTKISIYKWFDDRQQWRQVRDIGKWVLFLNEMYCINMQLEEGRENLLYYDVRHSFQEEYICVGINQLDLKSGKDVLLKRNPMGLFLYYEFVLPVWVTPSLI